MYLAHEVDLNGSRTSVGLQRSLGKEHDLGTYEAWRPLTISWIIERMLQGDRNVLARYRFVLQTEYASLAVWNAWLINSLCWIFSRRRNLTVQFACDRWKNVWYAILYMFIMPSNIYSNVYLYARFYLKYLISFVKNILFLFFMNELIEFYIFS